MANLLPYIEKLGSKDKDFRYMAASDLLNELSKDTFRTDAETERRICEVVVKALDDSSGDVSGLSVRCLGRLVGKVSDVRAEEMVNVLCTRVISDRKGQQRDIASIGLKTIIAEVPFGPMATRCAASITNNMLKGVESKDSFEVINESLDILTELLSKFGNLVTGDHSRIKSSLVPHLDDNRVAVRKRALHCLAALAVYLSDELLEGAIVHLLTKLQSKSAKTDVVRTYIQSVAAVSRAVGYRFGKHLDVAVPLVLEYAKKAGEGDDELREHCLQALEGFMLRCPADARKHLPALIEAALSFVKYDPNYADDMEEDEEEGEEEEDDDIGSDDDYSDDEDMSWKVRRAAAKCISAAVNNFPEHLKETYAKASPELLQRFKEREESVKADVFHAFIDLLHQVGLVSKRGGQELSEGLRNQVGEDVGAVVRACARQLKEKSAKTKVGVFLVLKELVTVLPGCITDHVATLLPGMLHALNDKSSNSQLKIEALLFLRQALAAPTSSVYQPHIPQLAPAVFTCVSERYYKVAAEALRVCEQLVVVLRPSPPSSVPPALSAVVTSMQGVVMQRLTAQDQDQEVKEAAIMCSAGFLSSLGDLQGVEVQKILSLLLDRLRNDITRLTAVKAFAIIAASSLPLDLATVLEPALQELASFLRKANRALRLSSLTALDALAGRCGAEFAGPAVQQYMTEAAGLISDADLSVTTHSLRFCVTLLGKQPAAAAAVLDKVVPQALALVVSPLLQGAALEALQSFFIAAAAAGSPQASLQVLLSRLLAAGVSKEGGTKQAQHSVARCVALLCISAGADSVQTTVQQLLGMLKSPSDAASPRLALLCLGELGRHTDLSTSPAVEAAITSALSSDAEDIKTAASLALGGVACGNLGVFMPSLLSQIQGSSVNAKQQYLLLQALNEVISSIAQKGQKKIDFSQGMRDEVLQLLLNNCEGEEECRNVVAECLGRLSLLYPQLVLDTLHGLLTAPSAHVRGVVASAVKYTIVDRAHPIDEQLRKVLPEVLLLMRDEDRHVRRAAVVALSATAHHKASLVSGHMVQLLPMLYEQTRIREDMIRTVDLGPFKHKIDDGLELRKAAFECMDILLESCPDSLPVAEFLQHLESGLRDHYDVKLPCHTMLASLAANAPAAVLAALDRLVEPLEKTLTTRLKSDAVKQEKDRHEDMLRSCLRAVDALNRLTGSESCAPFQAFMKRTVMAGVLKETFLQIEKERAEAEHGGDGMDLA